MPDRPTPTDDCVPFSRADGLALAGLLGLMVLLLARFLFVWPPPPILPDSDLGTDMTRETYPLARFVADSVRETGELPLWRPYLLSGAPLIGHPVGPLFYPPDWLVVILPVALALNLNVLFHLWWSGAGMYLVLRLETHLRPAPAFIGALVFALSPKWIAHLGGGHWAIIAAVAWWPWAWLAFTRWWSTGRLRWAVLLGVALGAQTLNHGNYLILSGIWLGACTFGYARRDLKRWLKRAALGWGIALLIALGLAAGQLWPFLELLPYTNRTSLTPQEASFGSLPPALLLGVLFPSTLEFPEWFVFPGVMALLLVLAGRAGGWSAREKRWGAAALVALIMALGMNTPVYRLIYETLPGFNLLRTAARWWLFVVFAASVLAGIGAQKWLDGTVARQRPIKPLIALAILYLAGTGLTLAMPGLLPFRFIPHIFVLGIGAALLLGAPSRRRLALLGVVLFVEAGWVANTLIRPAPVDELTEPDRAITEFLAAAPDDARSLAPYKNLPQAAVVERGLRTADGYDPFSLVAYADLVERAVGCDYSGYAVAVPPMQASKDAEDDCPQIQPDLRLLKLLNVRYIILEYRPRIPDLPVLQAGERRVYELGPGVGRAFGVARGVVASHALCLDRLAALDPSAEAVVDSPLPFAEDSIPPQVLLHTATNNSEEFTVQAEGAGLLVRSEAWAPGWRATVDGHSAEVLRVDCALQGVWLDVGEHTVRFEYLPQGYRAGRWISLGTDLLVACWALGLLLYAARDAGFRVRHQRD